MGNDDDSKIMLGENDKQPTSIEFCDFVMVDADEDGSEYMTDDDDDESYDYCEDACSMLSNTTTNHDLTGSLVCMKDSILTVPDVLMRDLDEAHAAARLVQFHDDTADEDSKVPGSSREPPRSSDHYSSASSVVSMEDESSSSPPLAQVVESKCLEDSGKNNTSVEPKEPAKTQANPAQNEINSHIFSIGVTTKKDGSTNSKGTGSMSRTSNKKRRKKLKMIKKAQAAASATQQLAEKAREAETTEAVTSLKQLPQQQQKTKLRSSNKKMTNIAVACATETMAAYREELLLRGIK
jgi:hypothetical protein